jgi:hypothetical protein
MSVRGAVVARVQRNRASTSGGMLLNFRGKEGYFAQTVADLQHSGVETGCGD